ncbi:hypothetical protein ACQ4PT_046190 [Festuca glaucescens]
MQKPLNTASSMASASTSPATVKSRSPLQDLNFLPMAHALPRAENLKAAARPRRGPPQKLQLGLDVDDHAQGDGNLDMIVQEEELAQPDPDHDHGDAHKIRSSPFSPSFCRILSSDISRWRDVMCQAKSGMGKTACGIVPHERAGLPGYSILWRYSHKETLRIYLPSSLWWAQLEGFYL